MAIVLIHLSDIHIASPTDAIVNRALQIKQAVLTTYPMPEACFIVVSGDIANTGAAAEYATALSFLNDLRSTLQASGIANVAIIVIPGNHDTNLEDEVDVRTDLLDSVEQYVSKPIDFTGLKYDSVIAVHSNFFKFEALVSRHSLIAQQDRLYYTKSFVVGKKRVVFHCFNTAWLSRRKEVQSKLYVPSQVLKSELDANPDLSIALFHHPYNWLNHTNYRTLKNYVEAHSDIILTGHEHVSGASRQQSERGETMDYIQGSALQDPETGLSSFQVLSFDFDVVEQKLTRYEWSDNLYSQGETITWSLRRNENRPQTSAKNSQSFLRKLHSIGTGFHHPRCTPPCELLLRDLYIYPSLRHHDFERDLTTDSGAPVTISGDALASFVLDKRRTIIYGADDSGKSALAKILYDDLALKSYTPLLLTGEELKSKYKPGQLQETLKSAIAEQYSATAIELVMQMDKANKVVIIDDFEFARFTGKNQEAVLAYLGLYFDKIVIFASDLLQLQHMTARREATQFPHFTSCSIKEFGRYHRQRLIHKWLYFGKEDTAEFESLSRAVAETEKTLSTLLGKNVLPHYPVTILTLLQLLESKQTINTANGSYGYLYEVLIKSALAGVGQGPSDVDAKITYMSGVGFHMFRLRRSQLTRDEFRSAHDLYCDRYDMDRDFSHMTADLLNGEVMVENNQTFRFKYPYIYYYSVAKYFQENATELRQELNTVADYIYNDLNANILIFYVYLTKDLDLIKRIVASASEIYDEYKPCDMDKDVASLNTLFRMEPPPLVLNCSAPSANRDEHNAKQDAAHEEDHEDESDEPGVSLKYDRSLESLIKMQIAFKTLQILGQVLRNFTGSLPGELKQAITQECFGLGMRVLTFVFTFADGDLDGMRQYLGSLIAERTGLRDQDKLATRADVAILWLSGAAAFGCIKRVSYAVGHADLSRTYTKVLAEHQDLGTAMIDASIKLDHFVRVPYPELDDIRRRVRGNAFSREVMRDVVADHLYLYGNSQQDIQKLGSSWNIKVTETKYLTNSSKKN